MSTSLPKCTTSVFYTLTFKTKNDEVKEKTISSSTCQEIGSEIQKELFYDSDYYHSPLEKCRAIVHLNDPRSLCGYQQIDFNCSGVDLYQLTKITKCLENVGLSSLGRATCLDSLNFLRTNIEE